MDKLAGPVIVSFLVDANNMLAPLIPRAWKESKEYGGPYLEIF